VAVRPRRINLVGRRVHALATLEERSLNQRVRAWCLFYTVRRTIECRATVRYFDLRNCCTSGCRVSARAMSGSPTALGKSQYESVGKSLHNGRLLPLST
jgi:hypothetical protein